MKELKPLKNYYVMAINGNVDFTTISGWKKGCIKNFMKGMESMNNPKYKQWSYWRDKTEWKCVKVNIHFEIIKP